MGYFRTAILLAAMTALFMGIGYLVGGQTGMVIAFLVAAAMNLFAYWNSDKMVLSMYGAREVDARSAPELYGLVEQLARQCRAADAEGLHHGQSAAERVCHRAQSRERRRRRDHRPARAAEPGRACRRARARARPYQASRHAADDHHRDACRRHLHARQFRLLFRRRQRNNNGIGPIGGVLLVILAPLAAALVQFGISRGARIRGRPHRRRDQRRPLSLASALRKISSAAEQHPQSAGRAQSRVGASLHRQPAVRRAHGQSVLHPPQCREPHRAAGRDGRAHGRGAAYSPCRPAHARRGPGRAPQVGYRHAGPGTRTKSLPSHHHEL